MIKIDVITAYCGENQFEECCSSVNHQKNIIINHIIIKNLGFLDSQLKTFEHCLNSDAEYVCKLDADMVFPNDHYLVDSLKYFDSNVDRLTLFVDDYYSKMKIIGFHIIRTKAIKQDLMGHIRLPQPDLWITKISNSRTIKSPMAYVKHGYNPSKEQCYRFGYSRGKKLFNQKKGIRNLLILESILNSRNDMESKEIYSGYMDGLAVSENIKLDNIHDVFEYLQFSFSKKALLLLKLRVLKWFM